MQYYRNRKIHIEICFTIKSKKVDYLRFRQRWMRCKIILVYYIHTIREDEVMHNTNTTFPTNQQDPQKNSVLSIFALVFSVTGCLCFIGLILAIIDLVQKDRTKKHSLSKAALIISTIWIVLSIIFGITGGDTQSPESSDTGAKTSTQISNEISAEVSTESVENETPTTETESSEKNTEIPTPETPKNPEWISKDEYDQIQTGMSYEQVKEIIGSDGEEVSTATVGDMTTTIYMWYGKDHMSNANVTFQNDSMFAKAQFGLE